MKKLLESKAGLIRRFRAKGNTAYDYIVRRFRTKGDTAYDYLVRRFRAKGTTAAAFDINKFREAGAAKAAFDVKRRRLLGVVALIAKSALYAFLITASIVLGVVGIAALYYYAI